VSDEAFRNLLGAMSFLLAALSFLANERRGAINTLQERSDVTGWEKNVAVGSVCLLLIAAVGILLVTVPALLETHLGRDDLLRLRSTIKEMFLLAWFLLLAIICALGALVGYAAKIEVSESE
jgi:hypothetical protein